MWDYYFSLGTTATISERYKQSFAWGLSWDYNWLWVKFGVLIPYQKFYETWERKYDTLDSWPCILLKEKHKWPLVMYNPLFGNRNKGYLYNKKLTKEDPKIEAGEGKR